MTKFKSLVTLAALAALTGAAGATGTADYQVKLMTCEGSSYNARSCGQIGWAYHLSHHSVFAPLAAVQGAPGRLAIQVAGRNYPALVAGVDPVAGVAVAYSPALDADGLSLPIMPMREQCKLSKVEWQTPAGASVPVSVAGYRAGQIAFGHDLPDSLEFDNPCPQ